MVTRKPLPPTANPDISTLPYPNDTSNSVDAPSYFNRRSPRGHSAVADNAADAHDAWSSGGAGSTSRESLPASLQIGEGTRHDNPSLSSMNIPESLRIRTPTPDHTPRSSNELERPKPETTNPYLRRQQTGQSNTSEVKESSASAWNEFAERPKPPSTAPPPPPSQIATHPTEQLAELAVDDSTNPWQSGAPPNPLRQPPPVPKMQHQDSGSQAWSDAPEYQKPISIPPVLVTLPTEEEESPAWDETDGRSSNHSRPDPVAAPSSQQEDVLIRERRAQEEYLRREAGGWETDLQEQESGVINSDGVIADHSHDLPRIPSEEHRPALPPRRSGEQSQRPSRPIVSIGTQSESSLTGTGGTTRQKKETYEIKKVSWYDANASSNPRISPILVQNANGPCPLLALVNALTISTPADMNTALVETLRSREQVSLGLLLDAVFDELMSGRRGDAAQELPDVGDLYSFLITLHTGMNVNPRFFPPAATNTAEDPRRSMSHVHPSEREESIPGTFEDTREMKLYSTFSIPLIHGWLPAVDSPAYAALKRSANSYEDAQNLMFREEELEDKSEREGLSFEEQATVEDIATIRTFFAESATQLTPFGLDTITRSTAPGSVAILFRNDHFSTLYRHPETHQLLHLVTDMGYAGHEEIVWESLVDVNGENCEFFSGDFRLVGGARASSEQAANESEWTTVSRQANQHQRGGSQSQNVDATVLSSQGNPDVAPLSPNTEQEDHDLALALQLQEEEEERHRAETARRRRETELSQQYIEQQEGGGPGIASPRVPRGGANIPVTGRGGRRNSSGPRRGTAELRPAIPPRRTQPPPQRDRVDPEAGVDVPPPSYEQAATTPVYNPPPNHPSHPSASPMGGPTRRTSAYATNSAGFSTGSNGGAAGAGRQYRSNTVGGRAGGLINEIQGQGGRRPQTGPGDDREDKCVVM